MFEFIQNNETALWLLAFFSVITFIGTLITIPWLIMRIPNDYFSHTSRHRTPWSDQHPTIRWMLLILKNLLGYIFLLLGFAMLLLPGQGILTIIIAVVLLNFPGKYRLERWIVTRQPILNTINKLRQHSGRKPLVFD